MNPSAPRAARPIDTALLASAFVVATCALLYGRAAGALASYLRGDSVLQLGTIIGTCLFASRRPWRPPPALPPMREFPLDRARVLQNPPDFVAAAAQRLRWAPWLVANIHLDGPLQDRPGAAPPWDNVLVAGRQRRRPGLWERRPPAPWPPAHCPHPPC